LELRKSYPSYFMSKQKVELEPGMDTDAILQAMKERFSDQEVTDIDGVKIDFTDKWCISANRTPNPSSAYTLKRERRWRPMKLVSKSSTL